MDVPFAIALGLIVAILDLIPLAGATIAAIVVGAVAFLHSIPAGIVVVSFFIIYQQIENHVIQPVVYGRTVQLSPLVVLISVLIGAELAGVLGALGAIPVAGSLQVLVPRLVTSPPRGGPSRRGVRPRIPRSEDATLRFRAQAGRCASYGTSRCWLHRARHLCRRALGRRCSGGGDVRASPRARPARSSRACSPT